MKVSCERTYMTVVMGDLTVVGSSCQVADLFNGGVDLSKATFSAERNGQGVVLWWHNKELAVKGAIDQETAVRFLNDLNFGTQAQIDLLVSSVRLTFGYRPQAWIDALEQALAQPTTAA